MPKPSIHPSLRLTVDPLEPRILLTGAPATGPGLGHPAVLAPALETRLPDIHRVTGVDAAHAAGLTGAGQTVVVIDSGVAYDHPALGGGLGSSFRVVGGWDFTEENDADPYDDGPAGYHGTHVAGIVAGNDQQHLGVAPGADIVALRVFNDAGRGKLSWLESSLQWVIDNQNAFAHPITTVNMSIGTTWNDLELPDYAKLEDELQTLHDAGIFVSGAAGNRFDANQQDTNHVGLSYPAVSPYVIPAASADAQGQLSQFSQRHASVLVVPGEAITSTVPDFLEDFNGKTDDFHAASGTSMAAPYLAGVSMLVRQAMEQAGSETPTVDSIYDVLAETSDRIFDPITEQYYHRVNVARAIDSIMDTREVVTNGDQLIVSGTLADDTIHIDQRGFVSINGVRHPFAAPQIRGIEVVGNGGNDRLTIDVRQPSSHVNFAPYTVDVRSETAAVRAEEFARIDVLARTTDVTAAYAGSDQQDRLYIQPSHSWMSSGGSTNYVSGAVSVTGTANDTFDTVEIYDGPGDDVAIVSSQSARLTAEKFSAQADGYSQYVLRAPHGGKDSVTLIGTVGNDVARSKPEYVSLISESHTVYAQGFETRSIQGRGGNDDARLFGGPGDDKLTVTPDQDTLTTPTTTTDLRHFTRVEVFANQGVDSVSYVGSYRDEVFVAKPAHSWATFATSLHHAHDFESTMIDAARGEDSVWLYDAKGNDAFEVSPNHASAKGVGLDYTVHNGEYIHAISQFGDDTAVLIDSSASDRLFASDDSVSIRGEHYTNIAEGFHQLAINSADGDEQRILAAVLASLDDDEVEFLTNELL